MAKLKREDLEFLTDDQIREFVKTKDMSILPLSLLDKCHIITPGRIEALLFVIARDRFIKHKREDDLLLFLDYIYKECTDKYGHLLVALAGDHLDPTPKNIVNDYLKKNK
jgi:hypothetical protein